MIRHAAALTLALVAAPATAAEWIGTLPEADMRAAEAAAVEADANWNKRSADGLAAMYAQDATLVVGSGGPLLQGRDAVRSYFTTSFARTPPAMRHTTVVDRLVVLAPDLVLADTRVELDEAAGNGTLKRVRDFNTLTVLSRHGGQWQLQTVRAYLAPPAKPKPTAR
jgi:uncharacterized protein (TIGR02246 family)